MSVSDLQKEIGWQNFIKTWVNIPCLVICVILGITHIFEANFQAVMFWSTLTIINSIALLFTSIRINQLELKIKVHERYLDSLMGRR